MVTLPLLTSLFDMTRDIDRRLLVLETSNAPAVAIVYYTGADGLPWQNNGGLCTPCPMSADVWEARAVKQQAELIAGSMWKIPHPRCH